MLFYTGDQIRNRGARQVANMGDRERAYRVLVGRPEGKRQLGRSTCIWEDNGKVDLQEVGWGDINWVDVAQDRDRRLVLVKAIMSLRVP